MPAAGGECGLSAGMSQMIIPGDVAGDVMMSLNIWRGGRRSRCQHDDSSSDPSMSAAKRQFEQRPQNVGRAASKGCLRMFTIDHFSHTAWASDTARIRQTAKYNIA